MDFKIRNYCSFLKWLALIVISLGIMYEGILRIIHPESVASGIMIFVAVLGLIINIILTLILYRSLRKEDNVNIQSALWHFSRFIKFNWRYRSSSTYSFYWMGNY